MTARLSSAQMGWLVFFVSLCVTPVGFPGYWFDDLGRWAVGGALTASLVGVWGTAAAYAVARRWLVGMPPQGRGGLWRLYSGALAAVLLLGGPVNLAIFARAAGSTELPHLPVAYLALTTLAAAAWAAAYGPETVARSAQALLPFLFAGLAALYLMPWTNVEAGNFLLPPGPQPIRVGVMAWASLGCVRGFLAVLALAEAAGPHLRLAPLLWANGAAGILTVASVLLSQGIFGAPFAASLNYPFVSASGTVHWQWLPISSVQVAFMLVWQAVIFVVVAAYLDMSVRALRWTVPALPRPWAFAGTVACGLLGAVGLTEQTSQALAASFNLAAFAVGVMVPTLLALWPRASGAAPPS